MNIPYTSGKPASQAPLLVPSEEEVFRAVVEDLFYVQEVHLIAGPSGIGKTTFLTGILENMRRGLPIFGHRSHMVPFAYLSTDRGLRNLTRLLYKVGIDPHTWPFVTYEELPNISSMEGFLNHARKRYPEAKLFVIEAIATGVPGNKISEYGLVARYLKGLSAYCRKHDVTIIGTTHSAKVKKGEEYQLTREKMIGSVAWGAFSETIISFQPYNVDDAKDPGRVVTVLARSGPPEIHHLVYQDNRLVPREDPSAAKENAAKQSQSLLDTFVAGLPANKSEFSAGDIVTYYEAQTPPQTRRTAFNALSEGIKRGVLVHTKHGTYKPRVPDALDVAVGAGTGAEEAGASSDPRDYLPEGYGVN